MSLNDAYTDVVELCALLQCLGFSVKSLNSSDVNLSQDGGTRTVVINCQSSGLNVVLESPGLSCSCPASSQQQTSGLWQVTGVAGGKQLDKEFGCTLLGSLPKEHRERLTKELREMIRCIRQCNESADETRDKKDPLNKSTSIIELSTPEKRLFQSKVDTPTRYRSLDTLTAAKATPDEQLPAPGPLTKRLLNAAYGEDDKKMYRRQSTYTLSSTPGSMRRRNKTSSPINSIQNPLLESLLEAEREAEELRNKIAYIRKEFLEEKNDSSMSSLALDVSKISVLKAEPSKAQFASSPNLSGLGTVQEDYPKSHLKRFESASTSNLAPKKLTTNEKPSRLRRLSPNIFKMRKDGMSSTKVDKTKAQDGKSNKFNSLFRPKIATPVSRASPVTRATESSPNLSASKRKFSHVKSTIPRPTPPKKE